MAEQQSPFGTSGAGANAFKAAYDRLKAEADVQKKNINQDYAGAYQQLRQQGYGMGLGAAAQSGLSGGQAAGMQQKVSAQQMSALGDLAQGQEKALRDQKLSETSIYSNALIEGQQAQQYDTQRLAQISQILTNQDGTQKDVRDLTAIERQQLAALGYNVPDANTYKRPLGVKALDMYMTGVQTGITYERDADGNVVGYQMINGVKTPVSTFNANR
jgi:hypothetical protein